MSPMAAAIPGMSIQRQCQVAPYGVRIKVACDGCHEQRIKCNGIKPCGNCSIYGHTCTYLRPRKKRGGASDKQRRNRCIQYHNPESKDEERQSSSELALLSPPASDSHNIHDKANSTPPFENFNPVSSLELSNPHTLDWSYESRNESAKCLLERFTQQLQNPSQHLPIRLRQSILRYPVLAPVVHTITFLKPSVLCDMLDSYFSGSPWVNVYLMKQSSVLAKDQSQARPTKIGLLYSMLCVAAHYHNDPIFNATSTSRSEIISQLYQLTLSALGLLHSIAAKPSLDDVISYIQLATLNSEQEYEAISMRWWNAAYQLAIELSLNKEIAGECPEELREERRRTWWLLYCADRQQALAVRKSLFFRDAECADLLLPCQAKYWNSSSWYKIISPKARGCYYRIWDCGWFGVFLPLMSILGEIVELHNLRELDALLHLGPLRTKIEHHLDMYEDSLTNFDVETSEARLFKPYAKQLVATFYILLNGKWDPVEMLHEFDECGLTTQAMSCAAHAVCASNVVQEILGVDPNLEFIPPNFGLFLLHSSFPLVLMIETFGPQLDQSIIEACEVIIRAHEVWLITKGGEFQRKFLRAFKPVVKQIEAQSFGHCSAENDRILKEMKDRLRGILSLCRWNSTGKGLSVRH